LAIADLRFTPPSLCHGAAGDLKTGQIEHGLGAEGKAKAESAGFALLANRPA